MATSSRTENLGLRKEDSPLHRSLHDDACSFEFFQAVSLLQRMGGGFRIGRFSHPRDEAVQFHTNNALGFPASQIQDIDYPVDAPPRMVVNFMGLTGPMGVLPYCYTEMILEHGRETESLVDFFDIFNHRIISLFYRGWEKYRFPITYGLDDQDLFTHHLFDLIGMGTQGLLHRQALADEALLHYVGLLSLQSRSAVALEQILSDYFDVPAEVEQFTGSWYRLAPVNQSRMNESDSYSEQLGGGAVVGDEIWDKQSRVRIRLGPLTLAQYHQFLPDGSAFEPLRALTRFFGNDELDFDVQLILNREEVPRCEVGFEGAEAPRLGWVTWMKSAPISDHPEDTILQF